MDTWARETLRFSWIPRNLTNLIRTLIPPRTTALTRFLPDTGVQALQVTLEQILVDDFSIGSPATRTDRIPRAHQQHRHRLLRRAAGFCRPFRPPWPHDTPAAVFRSKRPSLERAERAHRAPFRTQTPQTMTRHDKAAPVPPLAFAPLPTRGGGER